MASGRRDSTINRYYNYLLPLYKNNTMIIRYLMNPSASSGFYGRNRQEIPTGPPTGGTSNSDDAIHSLLHSISCSLSDVQRQLVTMQEQNVGRDSSMKKLLSEIGDLKNSHQAPSFADQIPKSKRSRKSPRGLSVSAAFRMQETLFNSFQI